MRTATPWLTQVFVVLLLLAVVTAAVRVAQSKLAFFPTPGEQVTPERFGIPFAALTIETSDGEHLRGAEARRAGADARLTVSTPGRALAAIPVRRAALCAVRAR